jgi:acyl carrier protein phosphodiesterase
MNFLAHLHIANHCSSDLAGNLLGDFVKGDPSKHYSQSLADGIRLHRFVDSYTDAHAISRQAKSLFKKETQRFAPIALDVFWDHCLATNWSEYSDSSLKQFCEISHNKISQDSESHWPENFVMIHQKMAEQCWLESYESMDSIEMVLERMSLRRPRLAALKACFGDLSNNYDKLQCHFYELYPDVLERSLQHRKQQIEMLANKNQ